MFGQWSQALLVLTIWIQVKNIEGGLRWALVRNQPILMPVSKISSVFPSFYSTNYTLGLPAAYTALERSSLGNLTFDISHALCFRKISNISEMPSISLSGPCVVLSNYSLGDFSSNFSGHPCFGLRDIFYPINFKRNVSELPAPPRPAPLCWKMPQFFR